MTEQTTQAPEWMQLMLVAVGGVEGLKSKLGWITPRLPKMIESLLHKKKEEHASFMEANGYTSLSCSITFTPRGTGVLILAHSFTKNEMPKTSNPLESYTIEGFIQTIVSNAFEHKEEQV